MQGNNIYFSPDIVPLKALTTLLNESILSLSDKMRLALTRLDREKKQA